MALEKLEIQAESGPNQFDKKIKVLFNPNLITIQKNVNWRLGATAGRDVPESQFTYGDPATLSMELFFDTFEKGDTHDKGSDVRKQTRDVFHLTTVAKHGNIHRPPICRLSWGKAGVFFQGIMTGLTQRFTLFLADGTPVRAVLNCAFREWRSGQDDAKLQNTQSVDVTKTHTVKMGETLSGIAALEYNDPGLWRPIADANGIDNPARSVAGHSPGTAGLGPTTIPSELSAAMSSANVTPKLAPDFRVRVDGADLPAAARQDLIAATVHEDVSARGMFTLRLNNWDLMQLKTTWSDDTLFSEGAQVEVLLGYVDNLERLLAGEITGLEPEFCADEPPILVVRGYDRGHRLLRGRKSRSFTQVKDSDIVSHVASDHGLTAKATDTKVTFDYVFQHNQTDLEFLRVRAQRIGYEVMVDDKQLLFRPRPLADGAVLTLARDGDLLEFYPRLTTLNQVDEVTVRGWDIKGKQAIVGKSATGDEASLMAGSTTGPAAANQAFGSAASPSVDCPVFTSAEADQIARGSFNEVALSYVTGEGVCVGRTDLRAGTIIKIDGAGQRFSGLYYVTTTVHSYSPARGYRTAFTVRRTAT